MLTPRPLRLAAVAALVVAALACTRRPAPPGPARVPIPTFSATARAVWPPRPPQSPSPLAYPIPTPTQPATLQPYPSPRWPPTPVPRPTITPSRPPPSTPTVVPTPLGPPSGLRVLYADLQSGMATLWAASAADPRYRQPLASIEAAGELSLHLCPSPERPWVAYTVGQRDRTLDPPGAELWLLNLATHEQQLLARGLGLAAPIWSPDGRQLAFCRLSGDRPAPRLGIVTLSLETRQERSLVPETGYPYPLPVAWSPDGRHLYYTQDRELRRVNLAQGNTGQSMWDVTDERLQHCTLSPDGEQALFTVLPTTIKASLELRVVALAARQSPTIVHCGMASCHAIWHPSGQEVTMSRGGPPSTELLAIEVPSGHARTLARSEGGPLLLCAWSPDGRWLAVERPEAWGVSPALLLLGPDGAWGPPLAAQGRARFVGWLP